MGADLDPLEQLLILIHSTKSSDVLSATATFLIQLQEFHHNPLHLKQLFPFKYEDVLKHVEYSGVTLIQEALQSSSFDDLVPSIAAYVALPSYCPNNNHSGPQAQQHSQGYSMQTFFSFLFNSIGCSTCQYQEW